MGYKTGGKVETRPMINDPVAKPGKETRPMLRASGGAVNPLSKLKSADTKAAMKKYMAGGRVKLDASPATGIGRLEVAKGTKSGGK